MSLAAGLSKIMNVTSALVTLFIAPTVIRASLNDYGLDFRVGNIDEHFFSLDGLLVPAVVGSLSGLLGLCGSAVGSGCASLLGFKSTEYRGQFVHFLVFALLWTFAILSFLLLFDKEVKLVASYSDVIRQIVLCSVGIGVLLGIILPLLSKAFYGGVEGSFDTIGPLAAVKWFVSAGALFGFLGGASFAVLSSEPVSLLWAIVLPTVLCGFSGAVTGLAVHAIGGLGIACVTNYKDGLAGAMFGILVLVLLAIVMAILLPGMRTLGSTWSAIVAAAYIGAVIGPYYPTQLMGLVERFVFGVDADERLRTAFTPAMKTIYMLIIVAPWGMFIAIGAVLSRVH